MWDIDTIDWDPGTTASQIVARVVPNAVSGSIVLMHLGGYATLDALPSVVSQLRSRGFQLTTASDMVD
jgi:peptidoglycan/xylan/chitin deacetylase (PgdA/CDA1 family)